MSDPKAKCPSCGDTAVDADAEISRLTAENAFLRMGMERARKVIEDEATHDTSCKSHSFYCSVCGVTVRDHPHFIAIVGNDLASTGICPNFEWLEPPCDCFKSRVRALLPAPGEPPPFETDWKSVAQVMAIRIFDATRALQSIALNHAEPARPGVVAALKALDGEPDTLMGALQELAKARRAYLAAGVPDESVRPEDDADAVLTRALDALCAMVPEEGNE